MRPDTDDHKRRLLGVLRSARRPLTTAEICDGVGHVLLYWPCEEWHHRYDDPVGSGPGGPYVRDWWFLRDTQHGAHRYCIMLGTLGVNQRAWQLLAALHRAGHVEKIKAPGRQAALWVLAGGGVAREVHVLEEMLALEAAPEGSR